MKSWTLQELEELKILYPVSKTEILAAKFQMSAKHVRRKASALGLKKVCTLLLSDMEILNLYLDGYTYQDIGKFCNVSAQTIFYRVKKHGKEKIANMPTKRRYNLGIHFFDKIDTEEKAYFLGLLYADGYNNEKSGSVSLRLVESDVEVLEKLNRLMKSERPLRLINYEKYQNQMSLDISSRYVSSLLANYGCKQAKSMILTFPDIVPENLIHHFCRGYFDGDGCISFSKIKPKFQLLGTYQFINAFQQHLINATNIKKLKIAKTKNIYLLQYNGRLNCLKIRSWLYKDATVYIQRKYDKFFSFSSNPIKIIPPSAYGPRFKKPLTNDTFL